MRKPRQYSKSGFYHVVIRGVNKQNIFYDDEDHKLFLKILEKYSLKYEIFIHAYCLMENHVHLEIEDKHHNISIFMQAICSIYARMFNRKYDRIGHLFQERYASEVIEDKSYFITVFRYIMQNPEKANICDMNAFKWSSFHCYKYYSSFVHKELLLEYFGTLKNLYENLKKESYDRCLEIELRYSEREANYIQQIKEILQTDNPILKPDLPVKIIKEKMKILKASGLSIRTISRVTGINKHIVASA